MNKIHIKPVNIKHFLHMVRTIEKIVWTVLPSFSPFSWELAVPSDSMVQQTYGGHDNVIVETGHLTVNITVDSLLTDTSILETDT